MVVIVLTETECYTYECYTDRMLYLVYVSMRLGETVRSKYLSYTYLFLHGDTVPKFSERRKAISI